jgi:ABC-type multidrug transport system fused ATPase/permease subunit
MIVAGRMELGTVVAFIGYLGYLYLPLERFSQLSTVVSNSLAAIERIFDLFDTRAEVVERTFSLPLRVKRGSVQFESVSFSYRPNDPAGRHALRDVSFKVEGGTTVALVGRSGAGKTTLASLIPRFYDATAGRVLIEGKDVRNLSLRSLRDAIGIVTQETTLFGTTIRENLCFGKPDAIPSQMWHALEQANIRPFVESLPDGLDTVIGERGVKLSGGQRQRIALARVFLKNPPILILDDATSALDSESENLVHEAMRRLMLGRTTFLIAHRLAAAVGADLIMVLEQGELVESGSHDELLERGGHYAQLFYEQARGLLLDEAPEARRATL